MLGGKRLGHAELRPQPLGRSRHDRRCEQGHLAQGLQRLVQHVRELLPAGWILGQGPWTHLDQVPVRLAHELVESSCCLMEFEGKHPAVEALRHGGGGVGQPPPTGSLRWLGDHGVEVRRHHRHYPAGQVPQAVGELGGVTSRHRLP